MKLRTLLLSIVGAGLALIALGVGVLTWFAREPLPDHDGQIAAPGLDAPVEIIRDDWGVPHIYAETMHDLMFAQGYAAAQDRWWTMDFYRHIANGRLVERLGRDAEIIENDILMRTLDLRGVATRDYGNARNETKEALDAYAAGVNAYIADRNPRQLAAEYSLLALGGADITIEPWSAVDTLVVVKLMGFAQSGRDAKRELSRARILAAVGEEMFRAYFPPYDYDRHPTVVKREDLPYSEAAQSGDQNPVNGVDPGRVPALENEVLNKLRGQAEGDGSNAWVVSGARSASGKPIVAVDPHQELDIPNIWHEVGLHLRPKTGDAFNIYGFAAAPSFLILEGNNDFVAWGTTNVNGGDSLDLFQLTINSDNPDQYLWDGVWRDMDVREDTLAWSGGGRQSVRLRRTHFGPVLPHTDEGPVYALRWGGLENGTIADAAMGFNFATNADAFRAALAKWDYPPTNFMYADVNGDIGWQVAGLFPIRAAGESGVFPTKGDTDATQWVGWVPFEIMPHVKNPASGMIASGNNAPVPLDYYDWIAEQSDIDGNHKFIAEPARGFRGARIEALLKDTEKHSIASYKAVQNDVTGPGLAELVRSFESLAVAEPHQSCLSTLTTWNGEWSREAAGPLVFGSLLSHVVEGVYNDQLPDSDKADVGMTLLQSFTELLETPESPWWDDARTPERETKDQTLANVINAACADVIAAHGDDPGEWRWGDVHKAQFNHPIFSQSGLPMIEDWGSVKGLPVDGGVGTLAIARWKEKSGNYHSRHIAAYRRIIDLSDLENSPVINSVGQSSHPASDHYADQVELWQNGDYRSVNWSDAQVRDAAQHRLVLTPAN